MELGDGPFAPQDFNECVSREELRTLVQDNNKTMSNILKTLKGLTKRMDIVEKNKMSPPGDDSSSSSSSSEESSSSESDSDSFASSRKGKGKGKRDDDMFARVKFKMPAFDVLIMLMLI